MAAPAISASTRYTSQGSSRVYWCPSVADKTAPTRSELNAGTDLSSQMADSKGWSVKTNQIKTPDMATRYESQVPGSISADDSSLTLYASKDGVDVRALLQRDDTGFIVWLDGGDTSGHKAEIFPVTISSVSVQREVTGSKADTVEVAFSITSEPAQGVSIPA